MNPSKKPSLVPSGFGSVRFRFQFRPVPVPSGSGSVTFFTSTFTSTEVPLFFDKWGSVIYGCDRIVEAFDLAPILGEISGLVCDLEAKTSQNYCFLTQMVKSDP